MKPDADIPQLRRQVRRALRYKELRESRPAIIAGVVVFLGLPLLWNLLYVPLDAKHEPFAGFASGLLLLVGWLFAAVVAAQSVCRDLAQPPGRFLLARPVGLEDVLRAKARVGFTFLVALTLVAALVDEILFGLAPGPGQPEWWVWLAIATVGTLTAYWIAFAAAAITRQTLSAVMLTGLVLALIVAVPLISEYPVYLFARLYGGFEPALEAYASAVLRWLNIPETWYPVDIAVSYLRLDLITAAAVVLVVAVLRTVLSLLVSRRRRRRRLSILSLAGMMILFLLVRYTFWSADLVPLVIFVVIWAAARIGFFVGRIAARSERALKLGTKSVAWTIGLAMVLLFTTAMGEVGRNWPVDDTWWLPPEPRGFFEKIAVGAERVATVSAGRLALFDVGEGFQLSEPRVVQLPAAAWTVPVFDEHDELYLIAPIRYSDFDPGIHYILLSRVDIRLLRVDWQRAELGPAIPLPLPETVPADASRVLDAAIESNRLCILFLVYHEAEDVEDSGSTTRTERTVLAVYRLEPPDNPVLERTFDLPGWGVTWWYFYRAARFARGANGRFYASDASGSALDPLHPDGGLHDFDRGREPKPGPKVLYGELIVGSGLAAWSSRFAFSIGRGEHVTWGAEGYTVPKIEVVGTVSASPFAALFRSDYPLLLAAGKGYVWEIHDDSVVAYDVRDPERPRKIAHVFAPRVRNAISEPRFLLLDHGVGFSIVRHPAPEPRR